MACFEEVDVFVSKGGKSGETAAEASGKKDLKITFETGVSHGITEYQPYDKAAGHIDQEGSKWKQVIFQEQCNAITKHCTKKPSDTSN